jgi:hypothetical protein
MTRDDLLVRVKQLINKPDTTASDDSGRPKNAEIVQALEEARAKVYRKLFDMNPDRVAAVTTVAYPASTEAVTLPTSAQDTTILRVAQPTSSSVGAFENQLKPIRMEEFVNVSELGTPRYYVITGQSIRLRPMPGSAVTLSVTYVPKLTALTASTSPTELGSEWHPILALSAAITLRRKNDDNYDGLKEEFDEWWSALLINIERRVNDNHIQLTDASNFWQG